MQDRDIPSARLQTILLLTLGVILLLLFLNQEWELTGAVSGLPLDDSWIHVRFADNLRNGRGFAFNPGEPTAGSTSPMWVLLLAITGTGYVLPAKLIGAVCYVATSLLILRMLLFLGFTDWEGFLGGSLALATGRFTWASLSGMETSLFTLATVFVIYHSVKSSNRGRAFMWAALGILPLIRPEAFLLVGLMLLSWLGDLLRNRRKERRDYRRLGLQVGLFLALAASYFLISFILSGKPLPNTFYARTRLWGCEFGPSYFSWLASEFLLDAPFGVFLSLLGMAAYIKRFIAKGQNYAMAILPLWLVGLPLAYSLIAPCTSIYYSRYTVPLTPLMALFAAVGFSSIRNRLFSSRATIRPAFRQTAGLVLAIVALSGSLSPTTALWAPHFGRSVRDIQTMHVAIGRWLYSNSEPDALIALNDIGAIGYFSQRRVLDLVGLVSPEVLPGILDKGPGSWDASLANTIRQVRPDYLVVFPEWYPEMIDALPLEQIHSAYIEDPAIASGNEMVVFRILW